MNGINAFEKAVSKVLKAGRNLGIFVRGPRSEEGSVVVTGNREDFPEKLWDLAQALSEIPDDSYEAHHVMPEAMAKSIIAWIEAQGLPTQEPKAIADWFMTGKAPDINRRGLMKIIGEQEQRTRELGQVAPRKPTMRPARPAISVRN